MTNCAICNQPMKLIPAGVSKSTGRAYESFYACEDKSHKQPKNQAPAYPPRPSAKPAETDWDKLAFGKCKFGFLIEAFKLNIELAQAEIIAEKWAKASIRVLTTAQAAPTVKSTAESFGFRPEEVPQSEDEIKVENIPF